MILKAPDCPYTAQHTFIHTKNFLVFSFQGSFFLLLKLVERQHLCRGKGKEYIRKEKQLQTRSHGSLQHKNSIYSFWQATGSPDERHEQWDGKVVLRTLHTVPSSTVARRDPYEDGGIVEKRLLKNPGD